MDNTSTNDNRIFKLKKDFNIQKRLPCDKTLFLVRCIIHINNLLV